MLPFVKFKSLQKPFSFTTQREHNDLLYTVCIVLGQIFCSRGRPLVILLDVL